MAEAPPADKAREMAEQFGLDQVIIIGRKRGGSCFETVTTFGRSDSDARACDMIGTHIKLDIMQWETDHCDEIAERIRLGRAAPELKRQRDLLRNTLKTALQYVIKWTAYQGSPSQWQEPGGALYDLYIAPIEAVIKDSEKIDG